MDMDNDLDILMAGVATPEDVLCGEKEGDSEEEEEEENGYHEYQEDDTLRRIQ